MRTVARRASANQRGIGYILGLVMLVTFIFMVALVVDIARVEIFLRTVQGAADAAALAGADRFRLERQQMGGTTLPAQESTSLYRAEKEKGFRLAKEAVIASLNESALKTRYGPFVVGTSTRCSPEDGSGFPSDPSLSPDSAPWSCYQYTFGTAPQTLRVKIERGLYYKTTDAKRPEFLSLEPLFWVDQYSADDPSINLCSWLTSQSGLEAQRFFPVRCGNWGPQNWRDGESSPPPGNESWPNWRYSPYSVAHAVKVTITLNSLPTLLASFGTIGLAGFSNVTSRETVASRGIALEQMQMLPPEGRAPEPVPDPW